ncbi:hypothetical protein RLEG12_05355 (plasmid) [Rhizobium leguminosarum bv. trifolii CB782]|nr:hypothetical protein RLEG12_05355 [Rhizobium leguminosarum bv. trifolii CB782]
MRWTGAIVSRNAEVEERDRCESLLILSAARPASFRGDLQVFPERPISAALLLITAGMLITLIFPVHSEGSQGSIRSR